MRGGARRPHARRTLRTLSMRPRAPTKQMGLFQQPARLPQGDVMIRSALSLTKTTPLATKGMVVAEHPLGAEVGAAILARGGNAVDAAVATAFAMPVVEPFMSTLAGGGSFLIHLERRGETVAIDANVEAPAACHEHSYALGEGVSDDLFPWRRVVDDANVFGPHAVAVPGE